MTTQLPFDVICLWEVDKTLLERDKDDLYKESYGKLWQLVEAYGVDDCGYACTPSKYASKDRHSYGRWTGSGIRGRIVTVWTLSGGTSLVAFNPPGEQRWLHESFLKVMREGNNWIGLIADGHTLYCETALAAHRLISGDSDGG